MRIIGVILLLVQTLVASGQKYHGEAAIPKVDRDGFYRVAITPQITTHLNPGFSNIRIVDSKNQEVPYLLQEEIPATHTEVFREYEIVGKIQKKNCCTSLILKNPLSQPINNISLSIKNADVTKAAVLTGSDDKENWFALRDHFQLSSINNSNSTSEVKIVGFPLSNYLYYKLEISDSSSAPLNILKAGYYEVLSEDGKYTEVPVRDTKYKTSDHGPTSELKVSFDSVNVVDKVVLVMSGSKYFLRRGVVHTDDRRFPAERGAMEFAMSSKQPATIDFDRATATSLNFLITNDDNPALQFDSIKVFQLNRYLTAYLKKDETYYLKVAGLNTIAPVYDLVYFKDSIPDQPEILTSAAISIYPPETIAGSPTIFTTNVIIWGAIIVVIVVLGFMAVRIINETSAGQ